MPLEIPENSYSSQSQFFTRTFRATTTSMWFLYGIIKKLHTHTFYTNIQLIEENGQLDRQIHEIHTLYTLAIFLWVFSCNAVPLDISAPAKAGVTSTAQKSGTVYPIIRLGHPWILRFSEHMKCRRTLRFRCLVSQSYASPCGKYVALSTFQCKYIDRLSHRNCVLFGHASVQSSVVHR